MFSDQLKLKYPIINYSQIYNPLHIINEITNPLRNIQPILLNPNSQFKQEIDNGLKETIVELTNAVETTKVTVLANANLVWFDEKLAELELEEKYNNEIQEWVKKDFDKNEESFTISESKNEIIENKINELVQERTEILQEFHFNTEVQQEQINEIKIPVLPEENAIEFVRDLDELVIEHTDSMFNSSILPVSFQTTTLTIVGTSLFFIGLYFPKIRPYLYNPFYSSFSFRFLHHTTPRIFTLTHLITNLGTTLEHAGIHQDDLTRILETITQLSNPFL